MSSHALGDSELAAEYTEAARHCRVVCFAGLPAVGKSLHVKQFSLLATEQGRRVHLLQYDVARGAFEAPEHLARYPLRDGVTHAMIRRAVGMWVRDAIVRWHDDHDPGDLLVAEPPLIGNRLVELAQPMADAAEVLLASTATRFYLPVPSRRIRARIESARASTLTSPRHDREERDAPPEVVEASWSEIVDIAVELGIIDTPTDESYDPALYRATFSHLLRHRDTRVLEIDEVLGDGTSVYDHDVAVGELFATAEEAAATFSRLERTGVEQVTTDVEAWARY